MTKILKLNCSLNIFKIVHIKSEAAAAGKSISEKHTKETLLQWGKSTY